MAHHARRSLRDILRDSDLDVLLTVSAPGRAPEGYASTGDSRFNRLWTLMGVPCVTIPLPGEGAPLGVQIIARFGDDARALSAAKFLEKAFAKQS